MSWDAQSDSILLFPFRRLGGGADLGSPAGSAQKIGSECLVAHVRLGELEGRYVARGVGYRMIGLLACVEALRQVLRVVVATCNEPATPIRHAKY